MLSALSIILIAFYDINIFINCLAGYIIIGLLFTAIYFISKEGIGLGDMFYMGFFASIYGVFFSVISFFVSFWIASLVLIIPFLLKKIDSETKIPIIPFLFSGCLITISLSYLYFYFT